MSHAHALLESRPKAPGCRVSQGKAKDSKSQEKRSLYGTYAASVSYRIMAWDRVEIILCVRACDIPQIDPACGVCSSLGPVALLRAHVYAAEEPQGSPGAVVQ